MRRADRLFDIVQRLRGGRLVTAAKLAEQFEVSERTIYRDIADLMASGVPIEGEAGVGYIMRSGYDVPPLMFTKAEVEAVALGLRMAGVFGGVQMAEAATEALVKIEAVLPDALAQHARAAPFYVSGWSFDMAQRARLDLIQRAIDHRQRLSFRYRKENGEESERSIRPLLMHFWGRVWTLGAWCETRGDFRVFRPDRMSDVELGEEYKPERGKSLMDFIKRAQQEHALQT
jgi:predicted DNA-binding transcriptional regulator YafY